MVKLIWRNREDFTLNLDDLTSQYANYFKSIIVDKGDLKNNSVSKDWKNLLFWGDNLDVLYYILKIKANRSSYIFFTKKLHISIKKIN